MQTLRKKKIRKNNALQYEIMKEDDEMQIKQVFQLSIFDAAGAAVLSSLSLAGPERGHHRRE